MTPPTDIAAILRGPHKKSLVDFGDPAPVIIIEPMRVVAFGRQRGRPALSTDAEQAA